MDHIVNLIYNFFLNYNAFGITVNYQSSLGAQTVYIYVTLGLNTFVPRTQSPAVYSVPDVQKQSKTSRADGRHS